MSENWDKKLLDSIWTERMTLCYKMLLICEIVDGADSEGKMSLKELAGQFQAFFKERHAQGKAEENPNRFRMGEATLSDRPIEQWERTILEEPVAHIKTLPIKHDGLFVQLAPEVWPTWTPGFRTALKKTAEVRLIEYFENNVPGGY
jgi:hypothetical protein